MSTSVQEALFARPISAARSRAQFRRVIALFQSHRTRLGAILALTLVTGAVNALEPLLFKYVFDGLSSGRPFLAIGAGIAFLASIGAARELVLGSTTLLTWKTRLGIHQRLLETLVSRLHCLPLKFYESEGVGSIMTRIDQSTRGVVEALSQMAFNVLPAAIYLLIMATVMFSLEWRLAILILVFATVQPITAASAVPKQIARERALFQWWVRIYSRFNEVLSGIMTVRSFVQEQYEKERFIGNVTQANQKVLSGVAFDSRLLARQNLIVMFGRVSTVALGAALVVHGKMSLGTLVAFIGYISGVFAPVQGLSNIYRTIKTASISLDSIFSILDLKDTPADAPDARELSRVEGRVKFEKVSFAYNPGQPPLLEGVNIEIHPSEMVALVGPSGAGKSTAVALLQRFYDPIAGRILIDDVDIRTVLQNSLRRQIAVVSQEPLLFNDTVYANITYGRPDVSRDEVEHAARLAHAHEFISRLPAGYDELAGERGNRFSAGERQRIAIARALLKNAPILLLDEATSAFDAESEALVQEALNHLIQNRTTLVVAHRLSTVVQANRVYVMDRGRIVEMGTHHELIATGGYYASLVNQQSKGLLPDTPSSESQSYF